MPRTIDRLIAAITDLELAIDEVACETAALPVPSFGGLRPTSTVVLRGGGVEGRGEHVGWTDAAHAAFRRATAALPRGTARVGAWSSALRERVGEPYDRAALEAAAIDLALRQRRTNLFRLTGVVSRPVRYVVSFARVGEVADERRRAPDVEVKLDVGSVWDDALPTSLARVAILDFKGAGTPADHERAQRAFPTALIEDPKPPWSPRLRARLSLDASITSEAEVRRLPFPPAAVNVKPARMGGVLEALRAAACCQEREIPVYLGGMFEVGVGRMQLRVLAALLAPDGPNDIAPIGVGDVRPPRPARLPVDGDAEGFA